MNETNPSANTPTPATPPAVVSTPSRLQWAVAALRRPPVLIATVALCLLGWQWLETRTRLSNLQQELAKRLAEGDSVARESRTIARQNQEMTAALQAKVAVLDAQLAEMQGQQLALEAMYQELSSSRDERLLAEVEQTLSIAAQQLQLAGNVEAALIALQGADARLARSSQPQWLPLRKLMARDMERLKALPLADISGMAMKLEGVIATVDSLPFAFEQRPRPAASANKRNDVQAPAFWQALWADFWGEVRQLVRVERVDQADPGLLSPSQTFFLRENLKLRLANARLSLLSRDARSFREDMRQSRLWLEQYFDLRHRAVDSAVALLKNFAQVDIAQDLPHLNETLNAVRNFKVAKGRDLPSLPPLRTRGAEGKSADKTTGAQ